MHAHCMQEWINTRGKTPYYNVQCPYCREPWDHGDDPDANIEPEVCPDIDGDAMNVYIAYLYSSGTLRLDATMPRDSDDFAIYLLCCFKLSAYFQDKDFMAEILDALFDVYTPTALPEAAIRFAYAEFAQLKNFTVAHTLTWAATDRDGFTDSLVG
jgi:hypothetical protein